MSNSKSIARAAAPRAGLPLRVRLFGGYAVLILFSLGLAGTGIWGLAAIGAQLYNLKHSSDALRQLAVVRDIMGEFAAAQPRFMLDNNPGDLATQPPRLHQALATAASAAAGSETAAAIGEIARGIPALERTTARLLELGTQAEAARARLYQGGQRMVRTTERLAKAVRGTPDGEGIAANLEVSLLQAQVSNWRFLATRDTSAVGQFKTGADRYDFALNSVDKIDDADVWGCPVSVDGLSACGLGVGHGGLHVCFVGHWRTISQRRMEPHWIVPAFDVAEACHPGFSL